MDITFTNSDYVRMEKIATEKLGWSFEARFGMNIKEMVEDPIKGKETLIKVRGYSGFVDTIKINKILSYLNDPDWKEVLKSKLS